MQLLSSTLLALAAVVSAEDTAPTAIRKVSPNSGEKILAEHLAFAPLLPLLPHQRPGAAPHVFFESQDDDDSQSNDTVKRYFPAFGIHHYESDESILRRAAQALTLLKRRGSCPAGMNGCDSIGKPEKCCQEGTVCFDVESADNGNIACCPDSSNCGGGVGKCPSNAVTCPASLGGGCCIAGYVCQGAGCVPSASAKPTTATRTVVQTSSHKAPPQTITSTKTTVVEGNPSTVVVILTVTRTAGEAPKTRTSTRIVTATGTDTGAAPWRPTGSSESEEPQTTETTQAGCPTGFYGCLATHGGGCCRTDRDCQTYTCPPPQSTTIVSNGRTIAVAATDVPSKPTEACAGGWFMCGKDAGPVAGCCPSGYQCGTASCFTSGPQKTDSVQKILPGENAGTKIGVRQQWGGGLLVLSCLFTLL